MHPDFPRLAADACPEPYPWVREAAGFVAQKMDSDGSHDAGHLLRVLKNCVRILEGERNEGADPDAEVVAAAALFHDVVNLPKDSEDRDRASLMAAETAREFFDGQSVFEADRLELLAEAIETHSYSRGVPPGSLEAKIVCDADRLEVLGAVGLARVFHVGGQLDRPLAHLTDPFGTNRPFDDSTYTLDHFFEKLLKVRDRMRTDTGRRIAERRHDLLVDYLRAFADETSADWSPESVR